MKKGLFVSFEGGEGAGKSTQIARLTETLLERSLSVLVTRQPGGTDYGRRIRELILTPHASEQLSSRAELFLYLADRAHHVDTVIRPALEAGQIVLCDRYTDSTLAYQGYGRQLDIDRLRALNDEATQNLKPDLSFWLDLDPEMGRQRAGARGELDRLEAEAQSFHERVRAGYRELARMEPERWRYIDAAAPVDAVSQAIEEALLPLLPGA